MPLDQLEFDCTQPAGLGEDFRRNGDLADIVQIAGDAQPLLPRASKPSSAPMATAISATRRSWPAGVGIAHLAQRGGHLHGAHEGAFQLRDVTRDLLFGTLLLRNVLQQADDRVPAAVRGAGTRAGRCPPPCHPGARR